MKIYFLKNHFWTDYCGFREKRFVFDKSTDNLKDAVTGAVGTITELLKLTVDTAKWGVDMLKLGAYKTEKGIEWAWKGIRDPGPPDLNMQIYKDEMYKMPELVENKVGDKHLDYALQLDAHLLFLNYKTEQFTTFMAPALDEYRSVDTTLDTIRSNNFSLSSTIGGFEEKIEKIELLLKSGYIEKGTTLDVEKNIELQHLKSEKAYFEQLCSYEVDWPRPQFVETEFPPGSGKKRKRLVHGNETVKLDIRELHAWLKAHTSGYENELKTFAYKDQKKKLAYERDEQVKFFLEQKEKAGFWKSGRLEAIYEAYTKEKARLEASGRDLGAKIDYKPIGKPINISVGGSGVRPEDIFGKSGKLNQSDDYYK